MKPRTKMVGLMAKQAVHASAVSGLYSDRIIHIKSATEFCNLARDAKARVRNVGNASKAFDHLGARFIFVPYEFGVMANG